jgi:hypothetical protein
MLKHSKKLEDILKYLVAATILAVPLYPKFPFIRVPDTFVSIRLEDFLIALVGVVTFLLILPNIKKYLSLKITKAFAIYLLVGLLSVLSAIFITKTVISYIGILHWIRRIEYVIPFFAGYVVMKRGRANLEFYLKVLLITLAIAFIYGFGQRYFSWPVIITQNEEYSKGVALRWIPGSHINSTFAGHYDLATFLVLVMPVFISAGLLLKNIKTRLTLLIVMIFGLWLLVNTASRVSLVSYMLATTTSLIFIRKYRAIPIVLILSIMFIGFSSNLLARYSRLFTVAGERINKIIINYDIHANEVMAATNNAFEFPKETTPTPTPMPVSEDRSTSIRFNVEWPRAIRAFSKNPLLGTGYSSITLATDNDYLRLLGEVGLLGLTSFLFIFAAIFEIFLKAVPLSKKYEGLELAFVAGIFGSLSGIFVNAIFIDVFEASKFAIIFWLFIGMAVSLATYEKVGQNN